MSASTRSPIGFVGGNDGHSGTPGNSEAANWYGGNAYLDDTADLRLYGVVEGGLPSVLLNPAGLTGIWATENTRDALFDGLRRRETFATSGVRLVPRLFGGRDLGAADVRGLAEAGYRKGVPMGSELPTRPDHAAGPTFLASAAKDALGANLDRIQIIKCWTARGMLFEKVYDVAASGGREPGPHGGALPPVGDTVDVSTATYRNDIGAAELSAAWTDPAFDPSLACAYYARSWRSRRRAGLPTMPSGTASRSRRTFRPASSSEPGPPRCGTPQRAGSQQPPGRRGHVHRRPARRPGHPPDDRRRDPRRGHGPHGAVGEPRHRVRGHPALRRGTGTGR